MSYSEQPFILGGRGRGLKWMQSTYSKPHPNDINFLYSFEKVQFEKYIEENQVFSFNILWEKKKRLRNKFEFFPKKKKKKKTIKLIP